jgi:hypothetical protein
MNSIACRKRRSVVYSANMYRRDCFSGSFVDGILAVANISLVKYFSSSSVINLCGFDGIVVVVGSGGTSSGVVLDEKEGDMGDGTERDSFDGIFVFDF